MHDYKPYLASRWHDEFDAWADGVRQPVRRPARADRVPQLGQRPPARGDGVAGPRGRGAVPEHDPAVLRAEQPHRARADRRRLRAPVGRRAGAQPLARRLLRGRARPARRMRAGVPQRPRRHARRDPLGEGEHARVRRHPAAERPAELAAAAAVGPALRAAVGAVRGARRRVQHPRRAAASPTSATTEAARAIMLIELAWYAHRAVWHLIFGGVLERHPEPARRAHRAGNGLDPRGLDTLDWFHRRMTHGGAAEAVFFGAVAKDDVADAERVLPTQLLGRRELPAAVGERAALRGRHRPHHVGRRLSALRGQLPVHDRGAARRVRAVPARRDEDDARDERGGRVRLRPRRAAQRSATASVRRSRRCRCRSTRPTIPPTRRATRSITSK